MTEKLQTNKLSIKHGIITKDNKKILIATGAAAFIVTFSLVAVGILYQQMSYQNRVIKAGKEQLKIATDSLEGVEDLAIAYKSFDSSAQNILNGNPEGIGDLDGKNSKIILEALPASYNFPALTSSVEKIVELAAGLEFVSMTGLDDAVAQKANASSTTPTPVEIPFEVEVKGSYGSSRAFIDALQKSIRPFQVTTITITADQDGGTVTTKVIGKSFFQPGKNLNLIEEKVQ